MHSFHFMLMACLTILIYINIQQLLTDPYLTSSKLTIYPFENYVYISNFGKSTSIYVMCDEIDIADWSRAPVAMEMGKASTIKDGILRMANSSCLFNLSFSHD